MTAIRELPISTGGVGATGGVRGWVRKRLSPPPPPAATGAPGRTEGRGYAMTAAWSPLPRPGFPFPRFRGGRARGEGRRTLPGDARASATVELAALASVLLASITMVLDTYTYQRAQAGAQRMAQVIADYVANQSGTLAYPEIQALGRVLRGPEIGADNAMVVRLTALHQDPGVGETPEIPWVASIPLGDPVAANALVARCPPRDGRFDFFGDEGNAPTLPDGITLDGGADILVAQLCVRLTNPGIAQNALFDEVIYRARAIPFTSPATRPPACPTGRPTPCPSS